MTSRTKKYKRLAYLFSLLSILVLLAPLAYYLVEAFIAGAVIEKLALGGLATMAIILTLFNMVMKANLRSPIWLILIGIFLVLENILPLIIFIAAGTILDEFVFSPLARRFRNLYTINNEIDKR
jgi:hypothetical protein